MKTANYTTENFGGSLYNVYYHFSFSKDAAHLEKKKETVCVLQIGKEYSKFTDVKQLKLDSLNEQYSHKKEINAREMEALMNINVAFPAVILKDLIKKEITFQGKIKDSYQYQEKQPEFKWKVEKDTKTILGYSCRKATVDFRGRDYVAWFTEAISSNNGSYKFEGLPGLILELYDTNKEFHFTAVG